MSSRVNNANLSNDKHRLKRNDTAIRESSDATVRKDGLPGFPSSDTEDVEAASADFTMIVGSIVKLAAKDASRDVVMIGNGDIDAMCAACLQLLCCLGVFCCFVGCPRILLRLVVLAVISVRQKALTSANSCLAPAECLKRSLPPRCTTCQQT